MFDLEANSAGRVYGNKMALLDFSHVTFRLLFETLPPTEGFFTPPSSDMRNPTPVVDKE